MKWHSPHKKRKSAKNIKGRKPRKIIREVILKAISHQATNKTIENIAITISPLEHFPNFFRDSPRIIMKPSLDAINYFLKGGKYNIDLTYESLDNSTQVATFPLRINQTNRKGVNFKITLPNNFTCRGIRNKEGYGLGAPLRLYNKQISYFIEKGCITNFETSFPRRPLVIKGDFTRIQTFEKIEAPTYMRCIIPTNNKDMIFPGYFLNCNPKCILFDIDSLSLHRDGIMGTPMPSSQGHYATLNINGCDILFYGIDVTNNCCLVIDSFHKTHINDFEKIIYAVRLVYAFFTGHYYKEEQIILTSSTKEFNTIENFSYQTGKESIISNFQIVDLDLFCQLADKEENEVLKKNYNNHRKGVEFEIFSFLCNRVISSEEFKRVLELITSGGEDNNPVIQGALYSVALETLTQIIYDENAKILSPVSKELFKQMRGEFHLILSKYDEKMDERARNIIKTKIDNLNTPTNRDKLEKPFDLLGITLTEEEKIIIESRNKYLHGEEPENSYEWFLKTHLNALNLFDLTARLILKFAKYEGHYFSPQFKYVLNNEIAKGIIETKFDPDSVAMLLIKLATGEFKTVEEIQAAKEFLAKFIPYIGVLNVLKQKVRLI